MTLTVENGTFQYPHGERTVLQNISFQAESGDVLAILGPNGAGKTTLLRCTMGLLRWHGSCSRIDGREISSIPYRELWNIVSYVPQARQVSSAYTVEEMILLGRSSRIGAFSLPGKKDLAHTEDVIERFHLQKLRKKKCSQLSGGELQMVLIARALVSEPSILILDEPESNLDFRNQLLVLDTITQLAANGILCIFNTHYPAHALRQANRALLLAADGHHAFGETRSIITEQSITEVFGVQAVIGDIETPCNIYQDIIPISIQQGPSTPIPALSVQRVIATVSIILPDTSVAEQVNEILHQYSSYIIGRMGMPYHKAGLHIMHVTLDAPAAAAQSLTDTLNMLPDLSVKTTYAKEWSNYEPPESGTN